MLKLIKNEWIKIFSKVSTYIMLVLVALFVIGFAGLMFINSRYEYDSRIAVDETSELEYLTISKPSGYEVDVSMYEFMRDSQKEWYYGQWQTDAIQDVFQEFQAPLLYQEDQMTEEEKNEWNNRLETAKALILADDWDGYVEEWLDYLSDTVNDPKMLEAKSYYWNYMKEHQIDPESGDWREDCARSIGSMKEQLAEMEAQIAAGANISEERMSEITDPLALEEYRLENGLENYMDENGHTSDLFFNTWTQGAMIVVLASVVMIVLAGGCVANEFSNGTIKFLLINPVKRSKIIISKYLTLILVSVVLIFGIFAVSGVTDLILFGAEGWNTPMLSVHDGVVSQGNAVFYVLKSYFYQGINLLVMMTMAFMISSLLRSSAVSIGIGVAALMGGSMLIQILAMLGCDWGRYILFANTDLNSIAQGNGIFPNQDLTSSIVILAVYMAVFLLTAYDGFTRREV
ncbi:MAG TPA: ABC transporter permease [Candidatus Fimimorpha excrementavium]|nr:ABC transporter permease [Candidatus Fimimorpha excrementavium]